MIWDPVFSPDGENVAAKAFQGREFYLVLNGKVASLGCENLWDLVFSPDGSRILMKAVEYGICYRRIIPVKDLLR
jgi:hypothetical protein